MSKIKDICFKFEIVKKYPNISSEDLSNNEVYFVFEDNSIKVVPIYDFQAYLQHENFYIVTGHEELIIFDMCGNKIKKIYTR